MTALGTWTADRKSAVRHGLGRATDRDPAAVALLTDLPQGPMGPVADDAVLPIFAAHAIARGERHVAKHLDRSMVGSDIARPLDLLPNRASADRAPERDRLRYLRVRGEDAGQRLRRQLGALVDGVRRHQDRSRSLHRRPRRAGG